MNKEFKKGVLEICVLNYINKEDRYGYQIVQELEEVLHIKESTIYPILKRLYKEEYLETYLKESTEGPARKYYKLTDLGREHLKTSINNWNIFKDNIDTYLSK